MHDVQIALAGITGIILFIFGLEHFSKEIQNTAGDKLREAVAKYTKIPLVGVALGAIITAIIQSSSATSVIAIGLVNAGVLSFQNSIGVILGANIGTTITAQLVAFKLTAFAPAFIIIGFVLSFWKSRYALFAKAIFYFGFVFFSMNLISEALDPLKADPRIIALLSDVHNPFWGILVGTLITALIQSSSVTTGLAIVFTQQGLLSFENAVPILMGANLGTTVTAIISIINMDIAAKKSAFAHILFNFAGVVIFLPFAFFNKKLLHEFSFDPAIALANFHLFFNLVTCLLFIFILTPFQGFINKFFGEGQMDYERIDLSFLREKQNFPELKNELSGNLKYLFLFIRENYNLVTLSLETNYKSVYEASRKRIEYVDFLEKELLSHFSQLVSFSTNEKEVEEFTKLLALYEYIFQIHDSVKDLVDVKESIDKNYIELKSDVILMLRDVFGQILSLFSFVGKEIEVGVDTRELLAIKTEVQKHIDRFHRELLVIMGKTNREDVGSVFHLVTYTQRLKDKLSKYHRLLSGYFEQERLSNKGIQYNGEETEG